MEKILKFENTNYLHLNFRSMEINLGLTLFVKFGFDNRHYLHKNSQLCCLKTLNHASKTNFKKQSLNFLQQIQYTYEII